MNTLELYNGVKIPNLVLGGFLKLHKKELIPIYQGAVDAGIRGFDTARDYSNEDQVGLALKEVIKSNGLSRDDIFITTKIGNGQQIKGKILEEIDKSLRNLQTDYVDLWLMHWPLPGHFRRTWDLMSEVYEKTDKVRAIGVANYDIRHFQELLADHSTHTPMVNQIEMHPMRTIEPIRSYMQGHNIQLEAYSPLCRCIDRIMDNGSLKAIAAKYGKTIPQIILRWHLQLRSIPVFRSTKPSRLKDNIDIYDFSLTDEDLLSISSLNEDYKYHLESVHCPGY